MGIHVLTWRTAAANFRLIGVITALAATLLWTMAAAPPASSAPLWINTTITSAPPATTADTTPTFAFTSNYSGARFQCSVDGRAFRLCASPFTTTALSQGPHSFKVRAVWLIFVDLTPASASFKVDSIAPVVSIGAPTAGNTSESSVELEFTATDSSGAAPDCDRVSGSTVELAFGSNTITVSCTDVAGNVGQASVIVNRRDVTPPVISAITPADGFSTSDSSVTLTFSVTDDSDGTPTCAPSPSGSTLSLEMGANAFTIDCADASDNHTVTQLNYTRVLPPDTTPPIVKITAPGGGATPDSSTALSFTVSEPAVTTCSVDGGVARPCASPRSYFDLPDGENLFVVTAVDAAGNVGTASTTWFHDGLVDLMIYPGDGAVFNTTTVVFDGDVLGTEETCSFDDEPAFACSPPYTLTNVPEGGHTFRLGGEPWLTFTVDLTPPVINVASPVSGAVYTDGSVPIDFDIEVGVRTTCYLDWVSRPCVSGGSLTGLSPGEHSLMFISHDVAWNITRLTVPFTVG